MFLPNRLLTPVLPPIDESTCANKVLGTLINFIPLLYMLATNPETSPVIPPPNETTQSCLPKLYLNSIFIILSTIVRFLFFSQALKKYKLFFTIY